MRRPLVRAETVNENLTPVQRAVLFGIVGSFLLFPTGSVLRILGLVAIGLGWWLVPRFWSTVFSGAAGGVLAGLLILGGGLRLSMRVVALLEPTRVPEFTLEGTLFIVIFIGAIFGGVIGLMGNLARRGLGLRSVFTSGAIPAIGAMALILASEETRTELFELGAGAWLNVPMFGLVCYAYGVGAAWVTDRISRRMGRRRNVIERTVVPT